MNKKQPLGMAWPGAVTTSGEMLWGNLETVGGKAEHCVDPRISLTSYLEHLRTIDGVYKDSLYIHLCKCVMEGMHIHIWGCLKNLAEGIGSPGAEVVGSCEPPNMDSEN